MSNVVAGIGRGQLKVLEQRVAKKRYIFDFYKRELGGLDGVEFMPINEWNEPNYWLSCITLNGQVRPLDLMEALEKDNIESRPLWKPMHMQPFFEKYDYIGGDVGEKLFENGVCLPSDTKMTRFGKFLRSTSLDELPELFNIIKGDMSIVGPRPLLIQYLPLYDDHQKRRHEVRPGLSGLAMAKGRNALTWEEKFAYDTYYANHVSFLLDVKIIFWTMAIVFKREGINEAGHATVSEFKGSNKETGVEFK
jgi:hypothetical protein